MPQESHLKHPTWYGTPLAFTITPLQSAKGWITKNILITLTVTIIASLHYSHNEYKHTGGMGLVMKNMLQQIQGNTFAHQLTIVNKIFEKS